MVDTMTLYAGEEETVVTLDAKPDPDNAGKYLIESLDGKPLCCEFSLKDHAYNVVLIPGSYVIIGADNSEMFKASQSDDHVTFLLPSGNPEEFYVEQYLATIRSTMPHIVLALRYAEGHKVIAAALYPRDLEKLPKPVFKTQDGRGVSVAAKGMEEKSDPDAPVEYAHFPEEMEIIVNAIYRPAGKTLAAVDPNAPKEEWF